MSLTLDASPAECGWCGHPNLRPAGHADFCPTINPEMGDVLRRHLPHHDEHLCGLCQGHACEEGCGHRTGCRSAYAGPDSHRVCRRCSGSGLG